MKEAEKKKLRRRAYVEAIKTLSEIYVDAEDLSIDSIAEVQRVIRQDLTAVLDRARMDEATGRPRRQK